MTTKRTKPKIKKGYSILNIVMGVILLMTSFLIMFEDPDFVLPGFVMLLLSVTLFFVGTYSLNLSTKAKKNEHIVISQTLIRVNTVCFIISSAILLAVILLPIIASLMK